MASKVLIALALSGALAIQAAPEGNQCPNGSVRFEGHVSFEENDKPLYLSKDAVLTIDVAEDVPSGAVPKNPIYTHSVPLNNYRHDRGITYSFCSEVASMESKRISLKAHIMDQAEDDKVEYIGETVVTAGSDAYEADLTLGKVEQGLALGEPSVADCQFGQMASDVTGIAVKAHVKVNPKRALPKPTYLAVTLREIDPDSGEPEVISIFAGDVSGIYEPGKPLPAFLCAKVPVTEEPAVYTLEASLHLGWDGFANPGDDERTPRKGDFATTSPVEVEVVSDQNNYSVEMSVKPYEPREQ